MSIAFPDEAKSAVAAVKRLQDAGCTAYFAGGCVRDLLMGRSPGDYDIATNAEPNEVLALFPGAVAVGKAFGVVRAPIGETWFEIATFRTDHEYADGRHPSKVSFTDAETDARRRDFTVNALFCDPGSGQIMDYVNGQADIEARVIRTVGDANARFAEDHLRILRAIRFQALLCFELEADTATAIRANAHLLERTAGERVRGELARILMESSKPGNAVLLMRELGILDVILPEVAALAGLEQPPEFHPEGDAFTHTVLMLNGMKEPGLQLAFAVLLHDIGKPATAGVIDGRIRFRGHAERGAEMAHGILGRLRFSSADTDAVCFLVRNHAGFAQVEKVRASKLRRLIGNPLFPLLLELHRLDRTSSSGDLRGYEYLRAAAARFAAEPALPEPWVTGTDIMVLGVAQGPEVGRLRNEAYDAQLEDRFASREALLEWLRKEVEA